VLSTLSSKTHPASTPKFSPSKFPALFDRDLPKAPEIIEGLLCEAQTAMFTGRIGVGKSPLLQDIDFHLVWGLPWAGRSFQSRPVIHFDFESSPATFANNLRRIAEHSDLPLPGDSELEIYLALDTPRNPNTALLHEVMRGNLTRKFDLLRDRLNHKPRAVVIVDPFDLFFAADKNRSDEIIEIAIELRLMFSAYPHAALILTFNLKKRDRRITWPNLLTAPDDFLEETSGVNEILARTDVRIGFDRHPRDPEILVLNGIRRDESFQPLLLRQVGVEPNLSGFELAPPDALTLADAFTSKEQHAYWRLLPAEFNFEEMVGKVPRGSLGRLVERARSLGLLKKEGGRWLKTPMAPSVPGSPGFVSMNPGTYEPRTSHRGRKA